MADQWAIVTGAGRGIGKSFVEQLLKRGYSVIGCCRNPDKYESMTTLASKNKQFQPAALDLGSEKSIEAFVVEVEKLTDRVELLINNAGINSKTNGKHSGDSSTELGHLTRSSLLNLFDINTVAPILLTQALVPLLRKGKHPRVLNVSSWLSSITTKDNGYNYGYCASKCALNMMNRTMAQALKDDEILSINCNPGWVQTDMGGENADLTPAESAGGMLDVLLAASENQSGLFFNHDGSPHPW